MERTILHCDLNAFYASVEQVHNPALAKVPMAVAGNPESRHGIILAKNELAKKFGVQTAETIWQAQRKCPELVLVPPRHHEYTRYSQLVNEIFNEFTDLVEPFGIDESWLDVTGVEHLFGNGVQIADTRRETVRKRLGLTLSVGVSFNKSLAKLGSDYKKPDATTLLSRENFRELVYPLPVTSLLYVGRAARQALERLYIRTIGELAASDKVLLARRLGKMGELIHDYANGIDESPVLPAHQERRVKSVGNGLTFRRDLQGWPDIKIGITALADEVAGRLRRYGLWCTVVAVSVKDPSFRYSTRQKTLPQPTHLAATLTQAAMELLQSSWSEQLPVRMLTITASGLTDTPGATGQLSLFGPTEQQLAQQRQEKLEGAMDAIREKYGRNAILPGSIVKNDIGV